MVAHSTGLQDLKLGGKGISGAVSLAGMKTDRIRTDITDIVFVFIFMSGFGFEYG
jgi:hypothetical protein